MAIALPELYEREKAENKGKNIHWLYDEKYELGYEREILKHLNYTHSFFSEKDNFIVCLYYSSFCIAKDRRAERIEYNFYIIENNGKYYLRYFNITDAYAKAKEFGTNAISNLAVCDNFKMGIITPEFKKYIKTIASRKIPLSKDELMDALSNIDESVFDRIFSDDLTHHNAFTTVELLDFVHKKYFATDDYFLPQYDGLIQLINFIFSKSKITGIDTCNLWRIDSLSEAKERLVDIDIRKSYGIPYKHIYY